MRRGKQNEPSLIELIRELASTLEEAEIARILNMKGVQDARGLKWTESRVRTFRRTHHLRTGPAQDRDEYLSGDRAMEYLGVSRTALHALIARGAITKDQITDFAPWRFAKAELDSDEVQGLIGYLRQHGRFAKGGPPNGQGRLFDSNKGLMTETERGVLCVRDLELWRAGSSGRCSG